MRISFGDLDDGKTYYLSCRAMNRGGLLSEIGISDGITIQVPKQDM